MSRTCFLYFGFVDSYNFVFVQVGTAGSSTERANGAAAAPDGGFVLAGYTDGNLSISSSGQSDFAVVKIDSDANLLWTWQVRRQMYRGFGNHAMNFEIPHCRCLLRIALVFSFNIAFIDFCFC